MLDTAQEIGVLEGRVQMLTEVANILRDAADEETGTAFAKKVVAGLEALKAREEARSGELKKRILQTLQSLES